MRLRLAKIIILCYSVAMSNRLKKIILLLGDIVILYIALYLTLLVRYQAQPSLSTWLNHLGPFSVAFLVWIIIFYIADLYNLHLAVNNREFFQRTLRSVLIAGLLTVVSFYVNPNISIAPKRNMVIYLIVFFLLFYLWRNVFNWSLNTTLPKNKIAVIGFNDQVKELIQTLRAKPHLGFKVNLIISNLISEQVEDILIEWDLNKLPELIKKLRITTVVFTANPHQSLALRSVLFTCLPLKVTFMGLVDFYETVTGKIPIEVINQMWFLDNLSKDAGKLFDFFKRTYDIVLASLILILTAPGWPLIGLLLKIENKESVFFTQTRAGQNNRPFKMVKFRTQRTVSASPEPSKVNDSRNTKVGRILRITRLDELPQVLNILLGDMSFVGPRSERPELIKKLEQDIPFYQERMLVKPGLTGWDQVSGEYHSPSKEDTMKKLQYDLFYIKNRSLYLDLSIFLKTIATVLRRGGV